MKTIVSRNPSVKIFSNYVYDQRVRISLETFEKLATLVHNEIKEDFPLRKKYFHNHYDNIYVKRLNYESVDGGRTFVCFLTCTQARLIKLLLNDSRIKTYHNTYLQIDGKKF